jgi:hypothetical protein
MRSRAFTSVKGFAVLEACASERFVRAGREDFAFEEALGIFPQLAKCSEMMVTISR